MELFCQFVLRTFVFPDEFTGVFVDAGGDAVIRYEDSPSDHEGLDVCYVWSQIDVSFFTDCAVDASVDDYPKSFVVAVRVVQIVVDE